VIEINLLNQTPVIKKIYEGNSNMTGGTLAVYKDEIYFSMPEAGKISKLDPNSVSPVIVDVLTGLNVPVGITFNGDDLYFSEYEELKISKINLASTLSLEENHLRNNIKLYPNPTNEFIKVFGITDKENYKIYTIFGAEITSGTVSENEKIITKNIASGMYYLQLGNKKVISFVKN
jgi:hypothetical protein